MYLLQVPIRINNVGTSFLVHWLPLAQYQHGPDYNAGKKERKKKTLHNPNIPGHLLVKPSPDRTLLQFAAVDDSFPLFSL